MPSMFMNRNRAHGRIDSILEVHIEALQDDPDSQRVVAALHNAKSDFHGLLDEIFDEIDAIAAEDRDNEDAGTAA